MNPLKPLFAVAVLALICLGCAGAGAKDDHDHAAHAHAAQFKGVTAAVCVLHPTEGNKTTGVIRFSEVEGGKVKITGEFKGLSSGGVHAFHIHEFGDATSADGTSAGGHYNPEGHKHGLPDKDEKRHAGDLGNLKADGSGNATYEIVVDNISVAGLKNPIIGRSVIVHEKHDDGGQPVGNAGPRIACGVIGIAGPAK